MASVGRKLNSIGTLTGFVAAEQPAKPRRILVLDVGGTHVKAAFAGTTTEIKIPSGPKMTPREMIRKVAERLLDRRYDAVSIGYPGVVIHGRIIHEPHNLGPGWVGFDFEQEFRRPTRVINDAAMQALGSYRGGRMLFLGLGTGLGTAMILDGTIAPMELAHLPYKKGRTYEDFVGEAALKRLGRRKWQKEVFAVAKVFYDALEPEYLVIGGGNLRKLTKLPPHAEKGDNRSAIAGGARLWALTNGVATRAGGRARRRAPSR